MNEYIEKLLCQAHLDVENVKDTNKIAERFAELIVRECAKTAGDFEYTRLHDIEYHILKHFGVEE